MPGQPVLMVPTAPGDAGEIDRFLMICVLEPLIAAGRIKMHSCDSVGEQADIAADWVGRRVLMPRDPEVGAADSKGAVHGLPVSRPPHAPRDFTSTSKVRRNKVAQSRRESGA